KVVDIAATLKSRTDDIANRAHDAGFTTAPAAFRAPHLIGLRLASPPPPDLPLRLSAAGVYVSVRGNAIRVAPHLYNTEDDIDRLFQALQTER
ncbi:MAG: hypothetical protein PVF97_07395, partial [Desulfobacterales bacterium]